MEKTDVRVIKTKRSLTAAMVTLLQKNDFLSITVHDLCAEALVSRSTFYVYFEDKYALMVYCLEIMMRELYLEGGELDMRRRIGKLLAFVKDNAALFRNLIMVNVDEELLRRIHQTLHRNVDRILREQAEDCVHLPCLPEVVTAFCAAGIMNAIAVWVRGNLYYSVDEMTECLSALLPQVSNGGD